MAERLTVVLYGTKVGTLTRLFPGADPEFAYDSHYLEHFSTPISLRMPPRVEPYKPRIVNPYIESLVPEDPATRERWSNQFDTGDTSAFSLLSRMGLDCPGAVQFTKDEDPAAKRTTLLRPVSEAEIAQRLRRLRLDEPSWALDSEHWSLGGQQSKFALTLKDGQWHWAE